MSETATERDCICAEIANILGFRLTDDQIMAVCDLHTAALAARAVPAETLADRVRADEHQHTGWALYGEMVETRNRENLHNQAVIGELKSLLRRACESDAAEDCRFDHHGGCQAHGFLSEPCPYPLIRQYLDPAEQPATREDGEA